MKLKLDQNQQKAVEHFEGSALVVAGPGSGKTTVIQERILNLIHESNVDPGQILALAFNKEAAKEIEKRTLSELGSKSELPEIRTLHAFGLRIINKYYDRLKLQKKTVVWSSDPERTIKQEIRQLKRNMSSATVTIYKIESELTGKCYIGQTTNPERRKREHFSFEDSTNPDLRQAMLNEGKEHFKFYCLEEVEGNLANRREAKYIEYYRDCAVINLLEPEVEQMPTDASEMYTSIYKIESKNTGICYIVQSIDSERSKVEDFTDSSNDVIRKAIEIEGIDQFTLEILHKEVPSALASTCVEHAIKNASSRSRAVFNRNNPLTQRYCDQLMIELFCEHFNIRYEELLKRPSDVKNLTQKIADFEKIVDQIQKAKRQVIIKFTDIDSIDDMVNSIIESIDNRLVKAFAEKYEKKKKKANAIDFQDMILYAVFLLETCPDICTNYREKYNYVLIDEFQDISPIDFRLIEPLSENLFAVGDDDQAIYGFRGGDSEIMQNFRNRGDVKNYEIARNYRSTSVIVEHSKTLMKHNLNRISKNLHAKNPATYPPIKTLKIKTTQALELTFMREFTEPVCQTQFIGYRIPIFENTLLEVDTETQTIGVLARYRSEVEKLWKLLANDFEEIKGGTKRKEGDPFTFVGRSPVEIIEGETIHSAKGKEYNKVILIHNTLDDKDFPFHDSDDITEDRRVFYVAMTRAKHELVILGGECQFVVEAGISVLPSKRRKRLERFSKNLQSAIVKYIDTAKKQVDEVSERLLIALTSNLVKYVESATESTRKQHEYKLDQLRSEVNKTKNAAEDTVRQLAVKLPTSIKIANENLIKELIPVLDAFESQSNKLTEIVEADNLPTDVAEIHQSLQHAQQQLLDSLGNHGLKPAEAQGEIFNPDHHEEIQPPIHSDDVPADMVIKEDRLGYLLHDQVIRKAHVIISKGENIRIPEQLDRVTEIYLDRLISGFQATFQLTNINKKFIIRKMVQYLANLDNKSLEKISSFAVKNVETIGRGRFVDYCVGPDKTYLCTDIAFRNFWKRMWKIVEESRKTPRSQNIQGQSSIDKPTFVNTTQKSTLHEPPEEANDSSSNTFTDGEIAKGIVVDVTRDEVMIDIGFKSEGYIPASEFDTGDNDLPAVQVGDEIDAYIVRREDSEGQIVLSKKIADQTLIWDEIATAHETSTPVKGHITEWIKGGLRVTIGSLRGFLPASQVELRPIQNLEQYVGQTLDMMVISLNKRRHNIVLSRRACLETELAQKRSEALSTREEGQLITGVVKNITAFGAFVDLGGVDGLLHKTDMAWKRIHHPSDVVTVGDEIEVKVIKVDRENEKISLSLKQMTSDPWENVEEKYPIGSTVSGAVVNIVDYGVFVQLEEGIDGLLHVSQMSIDTNRMSTSDIVSPGDEIEVKVLEIAKHRRRISLSMRKPDQQDPFEDQESEPLPDESPTIEETETAIPDNPIEITDAKHMEEIGEVETTEAELPLPIEDESTDLCEPTNSTTIEHDKEADDTPDRPEKFTGLLNSQIQGLIQETLKTEIPHKPPETVNNNSHLTPQRSKEILKIQIQNLKPAPPEENSDKLTEPIHSESLEKTNQSPSNIESSYEEAPPTDEIQNKRNKS